MAQTFYPTTTTYETSRTTIPTATKTKTSGTQPDSRGGSKATSTVCAPEDSEEKEYTGLKPTHDQAITLCAWRCRTVDVGLLVAR